MTTQRRLRKKWSGLLPVVVFVIFALVATDFILFANRAAAAVRDEGHHADGIVALTGGGGLRIAAGVELVSAGKGDRLLISGVNRNVKQEDLIKLAGGPDEVWACCVDIGYLAETTRGNAEETAAWAYELGYDSLIIVTSDYHMPRSLLVLERAMPDVDLLAWPVRTVKDPSAIWTDPDSFRGVFMEWAKWRVTALG